jgi:hypothetical protein
MACLLGFVSSSWHASDPPNYWLISDFPTQPIVYCLFLLLLSAVALLDSFLTISFTHNGRRHEMPRAPSTQHLSLPEGAFWTVSLLFHTLLGSVCWRRIPPFSSPFAFHISEDTNKDTPTSNSTPFVCRKCNLTSSTALFQKESYCSYSYYCTSSCQLPSYRWYNIISKTHFQYRFVPEQ